MKKILVFFFLFYSISVQSQTYFRFRADFSIKTKVAGGAGQIVMGTVYYDKSSKIIVYKTSFPANEMWVAKDSILYKYQNNKLISKNTFLSIAEYSIFHLALSGTLADYGLKTSSFILEKSEKAKDLVISTWKSPVTKNSKYGKILLSTKNKQLYGIVFQNKQNEVVAKQFFNNYQTVSGLEFPCEITQISYQQGKEVYEVTSYKNIVINDMKDETIYNFKVSK